MKVHVNKLGEALSILYDMELNNYLMNETINELNSKINELGHSRKIDKPGEKDYSVESYQLHGIKKTIYKINLSDGMGSFFAYSAVFVPIIGAVFGLVRGFKQGTGFFNRIWEAILGALKHGLLWGVIAIAIAFIVPILIDFLFDKERKENYDMAWSNYNAKVKNEKMRVSTENKQKEILINQRDSLIRRKQQANTQLSKYYNMVGIDPKYRSLITIGYMYEFYKLKISTKLDGTDGLYYLVRRELRDDQFAATLNDISRKLDTIISNQYGIMDEIKDMNRQSATLINSVTKAAQISAKNNQLLNEAVKNTSITAYNTSRIKEEAEYMSFMTMYYSL